MNIQTIAGRQALAEDVEDATRRGPVMNTISPYRVTPAVVFADRPEWPVYEAPALWYIHPESREVAVKSFGESWMQSERRI